jgi:SRSO17 transposase
MNYDPGTSGERRLAQYFDHIGAILRNKKRREAFAMYAMGLLSESERKSVEPMAARATGDAQHASAGHQRLHHFIATADWSDLDVRRAAARYAIDAISKQEEITTWVIDDTGFLKQGDCSVGVQRQYTGSAGKVANCQIGVSLSIATSTQHLPIDFELFLPEGWLDDVERRTKAKIPCDAEFLTKHDLALRMIERAARDEIPGRIVLADSFYGHSRPFREAVSFLGFDYGMAIYASDKMSVVNGNGTLGPLKTAKEIAVDLGARAFHEYRWREGTKATMQGRFAVRRVQVPVDSGEEGRPEWLICEWENGKPEPTKFVLTNLPARMRKKEIIRLIKERYRTERAYEEMKGELGLDHFEGRSYTGWHHHVSAVLCCYAFIVAERSRHFPPSAERKSAARAHERAA